MPVERRVVAVQGTLIEFAAAIAAEVTLLQDGGGIWLTMQRSATLAQLKQQAEDLCAAVSGAVNSGHVANLVAKARDVVVHGVPWWSRVANASARASAIAECCLRQAEEAPAGAKRAVIEALAEDAADLSADLDGTVVEEAD